MKNSASNPKDLSPAALAWFKRLRTDHEISDHAGLMILESAVRCFDRAELERGVDHAPPPIRKRISGSRPFSQVASSTSDDAIMRRLCGESE